MYELPTHRIHTIIFLNLGSAVLVASDKIPTSPPGCLAGSLLMKMKVALTVFATTALVSITVEAHSNLIYPKPRNAIDSNDPRWAGGKSPDKWGDRWNDDKRPCACRNGTSICDIGQTCLWMGVGCSIGCKECDGGIINGTAVGANPNSIDRCGSGMKATVNDPLLRTTNRY